MTAYILNLFDLFCTLYALQFGAKELNPLMRNVPFMIFYKTIIIGILLWWLKNRKELVAKVGLNIISVAYLFLNLYHLYFI